MDNDNKNLVDFEWFRGVKMQNIKSKLINTGIFISLILVSMGICVYLMGGIPDIIKAAAPDGIYKVIGDNVHE